MHYVTPNRNFVFHTPSNGTWHTLKVEVNDSGYTDVYVNGTYVFTHSTVTTAL